MPNLKSVFELAANENIWGDPDSLSGTGSNLNQTRVIRIKIPELVKRYQIKKMLDAPCGDIFWMKEVLPELVKQGVEYTGGDIVPGIIESNKNKIVHPKINFVQLDLTADRIPKVDMILTRDCFIHLSFKNILSILSNYKRSGSTYLLVSTYTDPARNNIDVEAFLLPGRLLNMEKFPFYFGKPVELIVEECTEDGGMAADKSLGLWKLEDINLSKIRILIKILNWKKRIGSTIQKIKSITGVNTL